MWLGDVCNGINSSYTLTGGTFSGKWARLWDSRGYVRHRHETLSLGGSGLLILSGGIGGYSGSGARQVFDFHGGTLVTSNVNALQLSGTAAPAVQGTFYQTGGTLAPGGIGTPGKTIVTGNYMQSGGALAIDLGGTTQATAFQNTAAYDYLSVTGSATVGGSLNVGLINGYVPAAGTTFTVLSAGSGAVAGSFSNAGNGGVLAPGNGALLTVNYGSGGSSNQVNLTTICGSGGNLWTNASGGTWGTSSNWSYSPAPGGSGSIAFFGPALTSSDTVTLTQTTTVGVVSFMNTAAGYTIGPGAGPYTLTLDNGASAAQINNLGGSHAVSALIA